MKPGIYDNISNAEYHGGPGVSNSGLALMRKSPLHFRAKQLAANDNHESTPAQMIGTAFHSLILEPHLFVQEYTLGIRQSDYPEAIDGRDKLVALVEELNKGRKAKLATTGSKVDLVARLEIACAEAGGAVGQVEHDSFCAMTGAELKAAIEEFNQTRHGLLSITGTIPVLAQTLRDAGMPITLWSDIKAEWMRNNGHRNVLEPEVWDQLHRMREAVMAHNAASWLINAPGKAEQSVYWNDQETGELCRCRPDKWLDNGVIADLKTTDDASPEGFSKSIANWGYDVQDAFYQDGCAAAGRPAKAFLFIAVEKTACVVDGVAFGVAVYNLDELSREVGRAKYRADLANYADCKASGEWPCYGERIQEISVPQWSLRKNEHLLQA
jgi:exodeoxyribonuclease VIII